MDAVRGNELIFPLGYNRLPCSVPLWGRDAPYFKVRDITGHAGAVDWVHQRIPGSGRQCTAEKSL